MDAHKQLISGSAAPMYANHTPLHRTFATDPVTTVPKKLKIARPSVRTKGIPFSEAGFWLQPRAVVNGGVPISYTCNWRRINSIATVPVVDYGYGASTTICSTFSGWQLMSKNVAATLQPGAHFVVGYGDAVLATDLNVSVVPDERYCEELKGSPCMMKVASLGEVFGELWETSKSRELQAMHHSGGYFYMRGLLFEHQNEQLVHVITDLRIAYHALWLRKESEALSEVNAALIIVLVFVFAVCVTDAVLGVLEVMYISSPIRDLNEDIREAAELRFLPRRRPKAGIKEINQMRGMFNRLQEHLEAYRDMLPNELFQLDAKEDAIENKSPTVETHCSSLAASEREEDIASPLAVIRQGRVPKVHGVVAVTWDENHNLDDGTFSVVVPVLLGVLATTGGTLHTVSNEFAMVTVGGIKKMILCDESLARCALETAKALRDVHPVHCGVSKGKGRTGVFTSDAFSSFVPCRAQEVISRNLSLIAMELQCSVLCLGPALLNWETQVVDYIHIPFCTNGSTPVLEVFAISEHTQEWMYSFKDSEDMKSGTTTRGLELIHRGKLAEAADHFGTLNSVTNKAARYWQIVLKNNEVSVPYCRVLTSTGFSSRWRPPPPEPRQAFTSPRRDLSSSSYQAE